MIYRLLNRLALACACAGFGIASVLTLAHASKMPMPCGASSGCDQVAQDPSSYYMGVPVSVFGMVAYIVLIVAAVMRICGVSLRSSSFVGLIVSLIGVVASALLTYHSITKSPATCAWCLGSGAMMVLSTIAYLGTPNASKGINDDGNPKSGVWWSAIPLAMVAVVAVIGGATRPKPPDLSLVKLKEASLSELAAASRPLGKADAPVTIVEFADLMCPACRQMHLRLMLFLFHNKGKVRLMYLPFPLVHVEGHELSQYAAELSEQLSDDDFWGFVGKVYGSEQQPTRPDLDKIFAGFTGKRLRTVQAAQAEVQRDMKIGSDYGVQNTPTYILFIDGKPDAVASSVNMQEVIKQPEFAKIFGARAPKGK